jgi:phosphoglycolate phosphatase
MIKALIFDLDGTLLDTIDDISESMNEALISLGLTGYSTDDYKRFVGMGVDRLVDEVLSNQSADPSFFDSIKTRYLANYTQKRDEITKPYSGILPLLDEMIQKQIKVAVLSNKPDVDTQAVIAHYFPTYPFAVVMGKKPDYPIKPNPKSVHEIMATLGVANDEILYIGDTGTDMMTAKNANLPAVGVLWGFRQKDELLRNGADYIINHPSELLTIIERINHDSVS